VNFYNAIDESRVNFLRYAGRLPFISAGASRYVVAKTRPVASFDLRVDQHIAAHDRTTR
jgi:hypothetical protein